MGKWFRGLALDPPCSVSSVAASQAEPKSKREYNLSWSFGCLRAVIMIHLSSLSDPPTLAKWCLRIWLWIFIPTAHIWRRNRASLHRQTISKQSDTALAGLSPNKRLISEYAQVPTNTDVQTQLCGLLCFDRPVGVWGPLETSCSWERCVVSPQLLSLIFCFVFVSLIETFSEPDKDRCSID